MDGGRERSEAAKEGGITDGRVEAGGGGAFRCHTFILAAHNLEFVERDLAELRDAWSKGEREEENRANPPFL